MLAELRIQNLVLIDQATITFKSGLNALTGETGSGKSAIMAALALVAGERADLSMIRHGSERGTVEALFDLAPSPELTHLLEEAGLDASLDEPLIIRREIATGGKGRAFLNNQPVHVSFLRSLSPFLFELVGQHANQKLFSTETHRLILDTYADLAQETKEFGYCWHEEVMLRQELEELRSREAERLRDIDRFQAELEEIEEAALTEGEDEALFSEYTKLNHSEELASKGQSLLDDATTILPRLKQGIQRLEELTEIDVTFAEILTTYQSAKAELEEADYTIQRYVSSIDSNPARMNEIDERLLLIRKLSRKYGATVADIKTYQEELLTRLETLNNASCRIDELETQIDEKAEATNNRACTLTLKRKRAATELSSALTAQLKNLNMPHVEVTVTIEPAKRSQYGDDRVEFFIQPNKGERSVPVKECASGGELSRLLLSVQTLLAGRQAIPCLIFDEVDANIGGETATVVGEKLHAISKQHQVLCITHFPQVAVQSDHHLQICKREEKGRTVTRVHEVNGASRNQELERMQGFVKTT